MVGRRFQWFKLTLLALVWAVLAIVLHSLSPASVLSTPPPSPSVILPPLQVHPLPATLAQVVTKPNDDYFTKIQPTEVGYLIWSQFPVKIYLQAPATHAQNWTQSALQAIREWQVYLPLQQVTEPEAADITLQAAFPQERSQGRVRSAQTSYRVFINSQGKLTHRCTVVVRPNQTPQYILAALRHELGHALGIWGHSSLQTDALYFAQVRNPPPISARDVNTLRKVYEQPTRLGWAIPPQQSSNLDFKEQVAGLQHPDFNN